MDSKVINAFALPGGKVFISRELMSRLENEAQMAGVLGHEIGHVVAQHIGKQMTRQTWIQIGAEGIGIATKSGTAKTGAEVAGGVVLLKYSREQELEADRYGMEYMYRAGYQPGQMRKVMEILKAAGGGGGLEMLSTHPNPDSRIQQSRKLLKEKYPDTRNSPSYELGEEAYRYNVLGRLSQLPPPPDAKKKKEK